MTINTSQIQQLLRPGLAEVFGDYPMYPAEYTSIFETKSSDKAVEIEDVGISFSKGRRRTDSVPRHGTARG